MEACLHIEWDERRAVHGGVVTAGNPHGTALSSTSSTQRSRRLTLNGPAFVANASGVNQRFPARRPAATADRNV